MVAVNVANDEMQAAIEKAALTLGLQIIPEQVRMQMLCLAACIDIRSYSSLHSSPPL